MCPDKLTLTQTSRLGFGCSGLMARLTRRDSRRLLETAFESGIRHFDTARMYGYGEAESVLGEFIASRRSAVTVTTKVGIFPPTRKKYLTIARGFARHIARLHPVLRRSLRRKAEAMTKHSCFDPVSVRDSVATSLQELQTDVIDILLLHDCTLEDLSDPALTDCLAELQRIGMVKHFGIASTRDVVSTTRLTHPALTRVIQFPNNPLYDSIIDPVLGEDSVIFTHSALGITFADVNMRLAADNDLAVTWSNRLGFDVTNRGKLAHAFLSAALAANPAGCVLFSSQRSTSISTNATVVESAEMWTALRELGSALAGLTV